MSGPTPSVQFAWDGTGAMGAGDHGKFVRWNNSLKRFETATISLTEAIPLADLSDVAITTPATRHALMYNGTGWVNRALVEADISDLQSYALAGHNHTGVYLPIAGKAADSELLDGLDGSAYALADKSRPSTWVSAGDLAGRSLADLGTRALANLSDWPAPGAGQYLRRNAGNTSYEFATLPAIPSTLDDLSDSTITTPASGQVLRYNGSAWVNAQLAYTDLSGLPSLVTTHSALTGLTSGDDHTQYVYKTPGSSTRNVVQASGNFVPLALKGHSTQAVALLTLQDSNDSYVGYWNYDGRIIANSGLASTPGYGWLATGGYGLYWTGSGTAVSAISTMVAHFGSGGNVMYARTSTTVPLTVQGAVSQSGNLQNWTNSSGAPLAFFKSDGGLVLPNGAYNAKSLYIGGAGTGAAIGLYGDGNTVHVDVGGNDIATFAASGTNLATGSAAQVPLTVRGFSGQTANLSNWKNSGGTILASVTGTGRFTLAPSAETALTASTERIDFSLDLSHTQQWATGALTTQRAMVITPPTYAFVGASTITNAVTLDVTGQPAAGTNATITNAWALRVQDPMLVLPSTYLRKGLVLRYAADHPGFTYSANLLEIQKPDGTVLFGTRYYASSTAFEMNISPSLALGYGSQAVMGPTGYTVFTLGGTGAGATLGLFSAIQATNVPLAVKGYASQSGHLFDLKNSSDTVLAYFDASGCLFVPNGTYSAGGLNIGSTSLWASGGTTLFSHAGGEMLSLHNGQGGGSDYTYGAALKMRDTTPFMAWSTTMRAFAVKKRSGQTSDLLGIMDVDNTTYTGPILSRFNKDGYFMTAKNSAPADGDINTSELAIWFDNTAGAAKIMFKAKDSGGTVRTGSVALT